MARFSTSPLFSIAMATAIFASAIATAPAAAPAPAAADCSTVIYGMLDCFDFVVEGSAETAPSLSCCNAIVAVVQLDPLCLCDAVRESAAMNLGLNLTRAITLPAHCHIPFPNLHNCAGTSDAITPAISPEPPAPASFPPRTPAPASFPPRTPAAPPTADAWSPVPPMSSSAPPPLRFAAAAVVVLAAFFFHI
ncbi:non-specific lipid transfer protein GPI-anchored 31-like [Wolffia australiana]